MVALCLLAKPAIADTSWIQVAWCLGIMSFLGGIAHLNGLQGIVRFFAWIGRNTLVVLVLHALFMNALKPFSGIVLRLDPSGVLFSMSVTILCTGGCIASAWFCDRLRLTGLLFGVTRLYVPRTMTASPVTTRSSGNITL